MRRENCEKRIEMRMKGRRVVVSDGPSMNCQYTRLDSVLSVSCAPHQEEHNSRVEKVRYLALVVAGDDNAWVEDPQEGVAAPSAAVHTA